MNKREPWFSEFDKYLFLEGTHYHLYEKMGAHFSSEADERGVHFAVWAPNAKRVSVVGDFNNWDELANPMLSAGETGVWETFVAGVCSGQAYKYSIHSHYHDAHLLKSDPFAFFWETPPRSASLVWDTGGYRWGDEHWMEHRREAQRLDRPFCVYEVHLGSWRRKPEDGGRYLTYRELAEQLPQYASSMGFTHVEFLPVTEHPLEASLGYQSLGYFAPTSRHGTPQDFMYLVDRLHQSGIGVIADWVPSRFPCDGHGLGFFDGTNLFEHAERRQGFSAGNDSFAFNLGRKEVVTYLISSALFWLDVYHIDGLRIDSVQSMLYLDYSRDDGEWIPNMYGGRECLEAISFLKRLNEVIYERFPDVQTFAEEITAWPMVSRPTYVGGLGFGFKWNVGWINDILNYMHKDPVYRCYHHNDLTFGLLYAFHENYILSLDHQQMTGGKRSLLSQMSGDEWQKFANLRLFFGMMFGHPGKKLLFMGSEFGQWDEWDFSRSLDWHLTEKLHHYGMQRWVADLNRTLRAEPGLYEIDSSFEGFSWIECNDSSQSTLSFVRRGYDHHNMVLCVYNFTPVVRENYRLGVPCGGYWEEILNSDSECYGGSGLGNLGGVTADDIPQHSQPCSVSLKLPPLSALFFRVCRD